MNLLYFLESLRNPVADLIFSVITLLGEETVFMAVGMIAFWCLDKYEGYYILITGFFGTIINQLAKMLFRVPRPWVRDPSFTIVESAREAASGYSFPSGHTQTSVGAFGGVARWNRSKLIRILAICACVLVPLSRMYLGVHTPIDVAVSAAIALALVFTVYPIIRKSSESPKTMLALLSSLILVSLAFLLFISLYKFPAEVYSAENIHNLNSAQKNAYTILGCSAGLLAVYIIDVKFIHFTTRAVWWAQIIKVIGGLALVLLIKEGLRAPLDAIFGGHLISRMIRYFLMVLVGGSVWPLTFKWFSSINTKNKKEEIDK